LVPSDKVDPYNKHIENYTDLDSHTLDEIKYFFEHYKDMETGKFIKVESFVDRIAANKLYVLGCKLYESDNIT